MPRQFELHQSSLKTYLMCPRQFYYQYIEKRHVPANGAAFLGSAVHFAISQALSFLAKKERFSEKELVNIFLNEFKGGENYRQTSPRWNGQIIWEGIEEETAEAIGSMMITQAYPELLRLEPVMIETYIRTRVGEDILCGGRIDAYDATRGLIDFKTARKPWTQEKVDTNIQLTFYFMLLGGSGAGEMHIITRNGQYSVFRTKRTDAQIEYLKTDIIAPVYQLIQGEVFPCCDPESWWCTEKWCPFYHSCNRSTY